MSTADSRPPFEGARIIVVMGVASSGKSAVGAALSRRLHAPFHDGDDYHPAQNKEKMRAGIPLEDADRWPWLESLAAALVDSARHKGVAVGACSALKKAYRDFLTAKAGQAILFVFLDGQIEVIRARIAARRHEFMNPALLDSQFATLERPGPDENVLTVDVGDPVETIVARITRELTYLRVYRRGQ